MIKYFPFLFIILLIIGCSSSKQVIVADSLDAIPVITGSVIDAAAFQKGGSLSFDAFKPGPGAAADDETDRLSLMLVKGIKEALPRENTHFNIPDNDGNDADCLLDGFIDNYDVKGHFAHLSVDGQIWLRASGEKILVFQTSVLIDLNSQNPKTVAYQIGGAIAHFIGSKS